ncbi:sigma-like protein [Streptomyces sp. NPDC050433]|uniref:sigma-like protein n=1 Tax=Streptomyces sp. NPDC050433 TaxID=3365615 RepID=UPI003787B14D
MSDTEKNTDDITTQGDHHAPAPPKSGATTQGDHHAPAPSEDTTVKPLGDHHAPAPPK